jgi:hypothetical protein
MPSRIVTYVHRYKRPPRKKKAVPLQVPAIVRNDRKRGDVPKSTPAANDDRKPAIVTVPSKRDRMRRREEVDQAQVSPEELAKAEAFLRRMMRPRGE